uniref:NET domain-containing protein n=1 Tax=viral metagenome TaxID=1070528 RepID=A0A6C0BLN0_9ZZZZ
MIPTCYLPREATVTMRDLTQHIESNNIQFFKDELPKRHKFIIQPFVIRLMMDMKRYELIDLIIQYVEENNIDLGWKLPQKVIMPGNVSN